MPRSLLLQSLSGAQCLGRGPQITHPGWGQMLRAPPALHRSWPEGERGRGRELSSPSPGGGRQVRLWVQTLGGDSLWQTCHRKSVRD